MNHSPASKQTAAIPRTTYSIRALLLRPDSPFRLPRLRRSFKKPAAVVRRRGLRLLHLGPYLLDLHDQPPRLLDGRDRVGLHPRRQAARLPRDLAHEEIEVGPLLLARLLPHAAQQRLEALHL